LNYGANVNEIFLMQVFGLVLLTID